MRGRSLPYRESTAYAALSFQLKQLCGIFETDAPDAARRKLEDSVSKRLPEADAGAVGEHLAILLGLGSAEDVTDRESLFFSIRTSSRRSRPTRRRCSCSRTCTGRTRLLDSWSCSPRGCATCRPRAGARPPRPARRAARLGRWARGAHRAADSPARPHEATALAAQRLAEVGDVDRADRAADLAFLADGNPLFIEQLVAALEETGESEAALPTTVKGRIAARLDAPPAPERAVSSTRPSWGIVSGAVCWSGSC